MVESSQVIQIAEWLNSTGQRWHRREDEPEQPVWVLDDGTGDFELRFVKTSDEKRLALFRRGVVIAQTALDRPDLPEHLKSFQKSVERAIDESSTESRRGKRRKIAVKAEQIQALEELAESRECPLEELLDDAIRSYLASS